MHSISLLILSTSPLVNKLFFQTRKANYLHHFPLERSLTAFTIGTIIYKLWPEEPELCVVIWIPFFGSEVYST